MNYLLTNLHYLCFMRVVHPNFIVMISYNFILAQIKQTVGTPLKILGCSSQTCIDNFLAYCNLLVKRSECPYSTNTTHVAKYENQAKLL